MKILGCDLHAKQQTIAMVDTDTGEFTEKTLSHEGNEVREFYAALEGPVVVGIEATGAMQWFLELLEELGIVCRVGHPAAVESYRHRQILDAIRTGPPHFAEQTLIHVMDQFLKVALEVWAEKMESETEAESAKNIRGKKKPNGQASQSPPTRR
jgi:hypothetical protein